MVRGSPFPHETTLGYLERDGARAGVRSPVAFRTDGQFGIGEIRDISQSGIFIESDDSVPVGAEVELRFELPDSAASNVNVTGEVVRQVPGDDERTPGIGIRILDLEPLVLERIQVYVEDQTRGVQTAAGALILEEIDRSPSLRFDLLEKLGEGGTSEVFKAYDREVGEIVALKLFKAQITQEPEAMSRIHREIRLARRIKNENVANVFEFGKMAGRDYLAMEFVPGSPLQGLLRGGAFFPEDRAIEIGLDTLNGLAAAHRLDIVHRDVKPSNLLITPEGKTVVLDFGLAIRPDDPRVTQFQQILGTPAYMAPEQIQDQTVGPPADIYSFGCVLFRVLTGTLPFQARTLVEVAVKHLREVPPPVRDLKPHVSAELSEIVARCLAKKACDRYRDADALSAALGRLQEHRDEAATILRPRRALLGESSADTGPRLRGILEHFGYELVEVRDGYDLVEKALGEGADVIFLDLSLPGIDPIETTQILRGSPTTAAVPLILLSEQSWQRDLAGFIPLSGFLEKPFADLELLDTLDALDLTE